MDYDLLAAFDHPGVDPLAQQQAAQLLSPQSQIQPPTFTGGAGMAEGRPQTNVGGGYYAADPLTSYQQASGPSNTDIAMAAWEAARQQQMQNATPTEIPFMEVPVQNPQRTVYNRNIELGRFAPTSFEDGSQAYYPGVGAETRSRYGYGWANPNGDQYAPRPTNMAGNYVDPFEFEQRRRTQIAENRARARWREVTNMAPFIHPYEGFREDAQLSPWQVVDTRRWRR